MPTSHLIKNEGSTTRDFCMLERNLLSHLKLVLLLSLLSSSFLLRTRLFPDNTSSGGFDYEVFGLPLSIVLFTATIITIIGGVWEFYRGHRDLQSEKAFLTAPKPHLVLMGVVSTIVFSTCITLLVADSL
ncbi:hypothetical protein AX17_002707 [Amanita inopinata Kibby_2008]|nr:hypothetical protein AX17_002707 [Amanita inopinata Kibby_2008]